MDNITNQDLFHLLNQRVRMLSTEMNSLLNDHGLYSSQWTIMYCLNRFGPMTQTAIWQYLHVEAPTITRTLSRMEKNGWIKRRVGRDKRERVIELTEEAKQKYKELQQVIHPMEEELVETLTTKEKKNLYHLLEKFGRKGNKES